MIKKYINLKNLTTVLFLAVSTTLFCVMKSVTSKNNIGVAANTEQVSKTAALQTPFDEIEKIDLPQIPTETEAEYISYSQKMTSDNSAEPNAVAEIYGDIVTAVKSDKTVAFFKEDNSKYISSNVKINSAITRLQLPSTIIAILSSEKNSVDSLGAFYQNLSLKSFIPSENLKYIGNKAFFGCSALENVFLPIGLEYIGDYAFSECASLSQISIFGKTSVGEGAFAGCVNLKDVYLSKNVEHIGLGAFEGTPFYENLTEEFCIINGALIKYNGKGGSVVIPNGVRIIADGVFAGKINIESVTFPKSIEYIGNSAFRSCARLSKVIFAENSFPDIGENVFDGSRIDNANIPSSLNVDSRKTIMTEKTIRSSENESD